MSLLLIAFSFGLGLLSCTDTEDKFQQFLKDNGKPYQQGTMEYYKRLKIFEESLKRIEWLNKHRSHPKSAYYGITQFADLTPHEFEEKIIKRVPTYGRSLQTNERSKRSVNSDGDWRKKLPSNIPQRVDWRDKGVIGSVFNQGSCGACWAFSIIETIESMVAIKTNKPIVKLSSQQLIDCSSENYGCDGGDTCTTLVWLAENNIGIMTEAEYPRSTKSDKCKAVDNKKGIRIMSNFTCSNFTNDESEAIKLLAFNGPLVAAVDATTWQDYLGGIIQFHCDRNRNHAAQIVGYDISGEIPYYIVRNTWGTEFGLDGYLHIAIGSGLCAIADEVSAINVII